MCKPICPACLSPRSHGYVAYIKTIVDILVTISKLFDMLALSKEFTEYTAALVSGEGDYESVFYFRLILFTGGLLFR